MEAINSVESISKPSSRHLSDIKKSGKKSTRFYQRWLLLAAMSISTQVLTGCVTPHLADTEVSPIGSTSQHSLTDAQLEMQTQDRLNVARFGLSTVNDGKFVYVLGGANSENIESLSSIEIYDPKTGEVEILKDIITPRFYHSAVFDGKESIYIMGGLTVGTDPTGQEVIRLNFKFEVFNTKTRTVTELTDYARPTRLSTAAYHNEMIFVLGGSHGSPDGTVYSSNLYVFNIAKNRWMRANSMPQGKETKSVIDGDWLYIVGGYDGKESQRTFERFNLKANQWETLPDLPVGISAQALTSNNGSIYAFGNYNDLSACYRYELATVTWSELDCHLLPARHSGVTTMNGVSYIIGGTETGSAPVLNYIQRFSPVED